MAYDITMKKAIAPTPPSRRRMLLVNGFGGVGYLLAALGIAFATLSIWLVVAMGTGASVYLVSYPVPVVDPTFGTQEVAFWPRMIAYFVAGAFWALTVWILVMLPRWVGKIGQRVLGWVVRTTGLPATSRTFLFLKYGLTMLPVAVILLGTLFATIPFLTAAFIGLGSLLAVAGLVCFTAQAVIARAAAVPQERIW